jgi:hypothetical protein
MVFACRSGHNLNGQMAEQIQTLRVHNQKSLIKAA